MSAALFSTRLTALFGITHPVFAGGLMWSPASLMAALAVDRLKTPLAIGGGIGSGRKI
ncbi:MAG: hypothetical protein IV105_11700 [Rhizobacter sp.]|nr:hypothetical protein [Rhizobacter sp.]